jgi:carboxyl-terminal processing protease
VKNKEIMFGEGKKSSGFYARIAGTVILLLLLKSVYAQLYPSTLSAEERIYGLSLVWHHLTTTFAAPESHVSPDTDSLYRAYIAKVILSANDLDYYRTLQQFAAVFKDANTYVEMPRALCDSLVTPPVIIKEVRGRFYVTNVARGLAGQLPVGSEILRVNGFDVHNYLRSEVLPFVPASTPHGEMALATAQLLRGWRNTPVLLNCLTPDGRNINESIRRTQEQNVQWVNPLPPLQPLDVSIINRDIAVITLNRWSNEVKQLGAHRQLSRTQGIIFDIRNFNQDVPFHDLAKLALLFSDQPQIILPGFALRSNSFSFFNLQYGLEKFGQPTRVSKFQFIPTDTLVVMPEMIPANRLSQPLMILTGPNTGNGAEHLLMMLRQNPFRVTIIGETTAGATGAAHTSSLPGGGTLHVKARYDSYPYDAWIDFGFPPDLHIPADIKSILNGEDLPMLKAIEILQGL